MDNSSPLEEDYGLSSTYSLFAFTTASYVDKKKGTYLCIQVDESWSFATVLDFRQPVCRGKYLFLVIYLLQLDGVNSLFADCCALRGTRQLCLLLRPSWDQMAVVHLRGDVVTPYIAVTFRHGVSLATSFVTASYVVGLCNGSIALLPILQLLLKMQRTCKAVTKMIHCHNVCHN